MLRLPDNFSEKQDNLTPKVELIKSFLVQAFLTYEDLSYSHQDNKWTDHIVTLKKSLIEDGRKFTDVTYCIRLYSLAYAHMEVTFFYMSEPLDASKPNFADGYTENTRREWVTNIRAPSETPYDILSWLTSSNEGFETTKNEWSYFRKAKKSLDALEWQSLCLVYSITNKNTGIVINGEILANKTHSDDWANNEFNFLPSVMFQPYNQTGEGR